LIRHCNLNRNDFQIGVTTGFPAQKKTPAAAGVDGSGAEGGLAARIEPVFDAFRQRMGYALVAINTGLARGQALLVLIA